MSNPVRQRLLSFLFYFVTGTLYAYALAQTILYTTVLVVPFPFLLGVCAASMLAFYFLFYNWRTSLVFFLTCAVSALILYLYLRSRGFQTAWYQALRAQWLLLRDFAFDLAPYREGYDAVIGVGVAVLLSSLIAFNLQLHFNFYVLTLLGFVVTSIPVWMDYDLFLPAQVLFLICFFLFLSRKLHRLAQAGEQPAPALEEVPEEPGGGPAGAAAPPFHRAAYRVREAPRPQAGVGSPWGLVAAAVVIVGLSCLLPRPELSMAESQMQRLFDEFTGSAGAGESNFSSGSSIRFTDGETYLGGTRSLTSVPVLEVESDRPVYLRGAIQDTYTGSSWRMSDASSRQVPTYTGTGYDISDYTRELQQIQYHYLAETGGESVPVTVKIRGLRSQSVFLPPFAETITFSDHVVLQKNAGGALTTGEMLWSPASYEIQYLWWDYGNPALTTLLREQSRGALSPDLQDYLAPYLQLPASLPRRVADLALEITAEAESNYDRAKLLERYLIRFPYTLSPGETPPGEDFVDYFLFSGQEGYCTYYASAFAVMGRAAGIPTRYVEGYVTPPRAGANGNYFITSAQGHAWVEIYIPGFGWTPFEPTAPYYYSHYGEELPDAAEVFTPSALEEQAGHVEDIGFSVEEAPPPPPEESWEEPSSALEEEPEVPEEPADSGRKAPSPRPFPAVAAALALLALSPLFYLRDAFGMRTALRMRRIAHLSDKQAVLAYFHCMLTLLRRFGYARESCETAMAFAERIAPRLPEPGPALEELTDIFSRACYGADPVSEADRSRMRQGCRALLSGLRAGRREKVRSLLRRLRPGRND